MLTRELIIRSATDHDRQSLANLIHFEVYVHRHLDWRPPIDWIGRQPCLVAERDGHILSALICPPDPPEAAWIRLFAVAQDMALEESWHSLWSGAIKQLDRQSRPPIAAIAIYPWFRHLLGQNGFEQTQEIISLAWDRTKPLSKYTNPHAPIRPMKDSDLESVHTLDMTAFGYLWRISLDTLTNAYKQSCVASVVEVDGKLVGYQVSTAGPMGGHLARLAVTPSV